MKQSKIKGVNEWSGKNAGLFSYPSIINEYNSPSLQATGRRVVVS